MKRALRQKVVRDRKNFFPTLIVTVVLWLSVFSLIYFVEPDIPLVVPLFFLLVFLALLFTFSTVFANSRRGLIISLAATLFLFLRYLGVGNVINLLLLLGVVVSTEAYFYRKNS